MRDGVLLRHRNYHSIGETTRRPPILKAFCHSKAPPFEIDEAFDIPPQHTADLSQHIHTSSNPLLHRFGCNEYHFQKMSMARHGDSSFFALDDSRFGVRPTWWCW